MLVQKLNQPACRVIRLARAGKLTHAVDPVLEENNVGARDVKCVRQHKDHLAPRLPDRVLDVVDWVWRSVGDEQFTKSSGDVIYGTPGKFLLG